MPAYPWLFTQTLDISSTKAKLNAMRILGVPYTNEQINQADELLKAQAQSIADDLAAQGANIRPDAEIIAMIAYLQRLGTDIKAQAAEEENK
jgi:cytochrome c oxidase cbb3-type subunit I/II